MPHHAQRLRCLAKRLLFASVLASVSSGCETTGSFTISQAEMNDVEFRESQQWSDPVFPTKQVGPARCVAVSELVAQCRFRREGRAALARLRKNTDGIWQYTTGDDQ